MKDDELLHKWVEGTLTAKELEDFKLRPEFDSLKELYENTEGLQAPAFDEDAMLSTILQEKKVAPTPPAPRTGKRVFLSGWVKYAVAASLVFIAGWFFWPKPNWVETSIAKAQKVESTLPDGSTYVLNAESSLRYDAKTWDNNRRLELNGEAFFKVKKGERFTVATKNGNIQVLGTQFNVRSRAKFLEVKCTEGKVAVVSPNGNKLDELFPRDAIRIQGGEIIEKWQLSAGESNWMNGIIQLKNVPLHEVLKELERQFDIEFDTGKVNTQERLTCNFQIKKLDLALKTTLEPLGIEFTINDRKVILK